MGKETQREKQIVVPRRGSELIKNIDKWTFLNDMSNRYDDKLNTFLVY